MKHFSREEKKGMTLLELLTAISVFIVISGLVALRINVFINRTKAASAEAALETIALGLSMARSDTGRYPEQLEDLNSAVMPAYMNIAARYWNGPYLPGISLVDPWGEPYFYEPAAPGEILDEDVFGPYKFSTGAPPHHQYSGEFTFPAPAGAAELLIDNSKNPVTSGSITINNGPPVVDSGDLGPSNPHIRINVLLQESNTIRVELGGASGRDIEIGIKTAVQPGQGEAPAVYRLESRGGGDVISYRGGR